MVRVLEQALKDRLGVLPKQCWWNALRAAKFLAKRKGLKVEYVEGWAVMNCAPIPYSHGWIEVDGEVVETTHDEPARAYFPGVRYDPKATRARQTMPIAFMGNEPGMRDAMVAAHAEAVGVTPEEMLAFLSVKSVAIATP